MRIQGWRRRRHESGPMTTMADCKVQKPEFFSLLFAIGAAIQSENCILPPLGKHIGTHFLLLLHFSTDIACHLFTRLIPYNVESAFLIS